MQGEKNRSYQRCIESGSSTLCPNCLSQVAVSLVERLPGEDTLSWCPSCPWTGANSQTLSAPGPITTEKLRQLNKHIVGRALTQKEWDFVASASTLGYPTIISSYLCLELYQPREPLFPGAEKDTVRLIEVAMDQLPGNDPSLLPCDQPISVSVEKPPPDGAWHRFNNLYIRPSNIQALQRSGLPAPKPLGYYQY